MDMRGRGRLLDHGLLALAGVSIVVFAVHVSGNLPEYASIIVHIVDLTLVGLYAAIFIAKGVLDENPARWFARHSWLAIALLPLTIPLLVTQPWFLIVQMLILLMRITKAIDRALHLHVMHGLAERYEARLLEELAEPLFLRLALLLEESVTSRDYAAAVGEGLASRRELVEAAVRRGIDSSPRLQKLSRLPGVQHWIDDVTDEVVVAAHAALTGPELNTLIRSAWTDAFRQLKTGIETPKWPHKGIGFADVPAHLRHHPEPTPPPTPVRSGPA